MPYPINRYDNTTGPTVADGTIDSTYDIKLIGKNYAGYGEVQNENFLWLLESFSSASPPPRAISGQVWFDSSNKKLKFYDGSKFRTTGGAEVGSVAPTGLTTGDFWFDTVNKQLWAWDGSTFILIGPPAVTGFGITQLVSRTVKDTPNGNIHPIIEGIVDGNTIFTISKDDAFELDTTVNTIIGFKKIRKGITLAYTNDDNQLGQTTTDHRFWGTASNSDRLGGKPASSYITTLSAAFNDLVSFDDVGFTVGYPPKLKVFNTDSTTPTIQNVLNDTIIFKTTVGSSTKIPMKFVGVDILPGENLVSDIGSSTANLKFKNIYAQSFVGVATEAATLTVSGVGKSASVSVLPDTIVVRTSVDETFNGVNITAGAVKGTFFVGKATSANYADLAEKYLTDVEYDVGTVVMIGGEKEVTACQSGKRAIGAVSANPAYMMNSELEGGTFIALKGRVPVKVQGIVKKGTQLMAGNNGTAIAADPDSTGVFAIALETSTDQSTKLVECLIL